RLGRCRLRRAAPGSRTDRSGAVLRQLPPKRSLSHATAGPRTVGPAHNPIRGGTRLPELLLLCTDRAIKALLTLASAHQLKLALATGQQVRGSTIAVAQEETIDLS